MGPGWITLPTDALFPVMPDTPDEETAPRARVLIVDDVPANLDVLVDVLDGAGYDVRVAESGEGALRQLDHARPDLILLDVTMPGIDGYETCRRVKADLRWRDTPVLFLTAHHDPAEKLRGFDAGAVDFITKPLHPPEVLARVRAHLQIRALQHALAERNVELERAVALRLEAERQLQESLDRAVLIVGEGGTIQFCTRLARRLLTRFFPGENDQSARLPVALADWAADAARRPGPWTGPGAETRLGARLFAEGQPGAGFMLLLEEKPSGAVGSPGRLTALGLTAREAEVLYWIAHGKTSPEIAIILDAAPNTIKKHVQNILPKLGVETRLAAALRAAELMGITPANAVGTGGD